MLVRVSPPAWVLLYALCLYGGVAAQTLPSNFSKTSLSEASSTALAPEELTTSIASSPLPAVSLTPALPPTPTQGPLVTAHPPTQGAVTLTPPVGSPTPLATRTPPTHKPLGAGTQAPHASLTPPVTQSPMTTPTPPSQKPSSPPLPRIPSTQAPATRLPTDAARGPSTPAPLGGIGGAAETTLRDEAWGAQIEAVAASVAVVGGLVGSGGPAMRLALVAQECDPEMRGVDGGHKYSTAMAPLGLVVDGSVPLGTVVGNGGLILGAFAMGVAAWGVARVLTKGGKVAYFQYSPDAQGMAYFPHVPIIVAAYVYYGTVLASMDLALHPPSLPTAILGALGLTASIAAPWYRALAVHHGVVAGAAQHHRAPTTQLTQWICGSHVWINARRECLFTGRWGASLRLRAPGGHWFWMLEDATSFAVCAAHATRPETFIQCGHVKLASGVVLLGGVAAELRTRPWALPRHAWCNALASFLKVGAMSARAIGHYTGDRTSAAFTAASWLLMAALFVLAVQCVLDVAAAAHDAVRGRTQAVQRGFWDAPLPDAAVPEPARLATNAHASHSMLPMLSSALLGDEELENDREGSVGSSAPASPAVANRRKSVPTALSVEDLSLPHIGIDAVACVSPTASPSGADGKLFPPRSPRSLSPSPQHSPHTPLGAPRRRRLSSACPSPIAAPLGGKATSTFASGDAFAAPILNGESARRGSATLSDHGDEPPARSPRRPSASGDASGADLFAGFTAFAGVGRGAAPTSRGRRTRSPVNVRRASNQHVPLVFPDASRRPSAHDASGGTSPLHQPQSAFGGADSNTTNGRRLSTTSAAPVIV